MTAPKRIQLRRTIGWRKPEGAIVVARPSKWGNPFQYHHETHGLVRYQPATPQVVDYEGRISRAGNRHDYYGPHGNVVVFYVRYATHAELVELYRRTLLDPTPSMRSSYPSRDGHFAKVTPDDIRHELQGRDLACWCPLDRACHADVLLEIANA